MHAEMLAAQYVMPKEGGDAFQADLDGLHAPVVAQAVDDRLATLDGTQQEQLDWYPV